MNSNFQFFTKYFFKHYLNHTVRCSGLLLFPLIAASCAADPQPIAPAKAKEPVKQQAAEPATAEWKTAYYKRGFVGVYQAGWAGGIDATLRMRVPIPFDGTKIRVTMAPMRDGETVLSKLTFAQGKDNSGTIENKAWPVNFAGAAGVTIAANQADVVSDAADVPIKSGIWYLQESYSSEKFLYAYHKDGFFGAAGDQHATPKAGELKGGTWAGNVYRIEVLTTDKRPMILCYGDSITHGYNSTPNAGQSYPEILGNLTKLPVLNLGVNSDLITYTGGISSFVNSCKGVESVIVVMGINDIISGKITDLDEYKKIASNLVSAMKNNGKKIYLGTITPAAGYAAFDKDPAKETLRQSINTWIRKESGADAVIDFDAALSDPAKPSYMREEYQSDWLHPNDAGYKKMAETAALVFKPTS